MGETRVDLYHLLEDLRDAYPGSLEETILTEIVANCLDSGAGAIIITTDPAAATFTIADSGLGMTRRELTRFHDIAATTKTRGQGIGFAGVGVKLGLLAAVEVVTETRRGASHVATSWHLASRHRAPWRRVPPPGLVEEHGTAVRIALREPLSPLLDAGYIIAGLQRHFQPLLDPFFDEVLAPHYPRGVRLVVNGSELPRAVPPRSRAPLAIRIGRRRKPSAVGFLLRAAAPLPEEQQGVAVSTLGKVIKRGWDWLGLSPASADCVGGLVEMPALAGCLQLSKADFIRSGPRGQVYLGHRKALQQAVAAQLEAWGDARAPDEAARRRKTRPLERDLESVLVDLADAFPLVGALVERHAGGQRRLPIGRPGVGVEVMLAPAITSAEQEDAPGRVPVQSQPQAESPPVEQDSEAQRSAAVPEGLPLGGAGGPRRPTRYGLSLRFESRPDDPELGRVVESTVWVNEAHPAYRRAVASRSDGYHVALAVAMALARLVVEPPQVHEFVTAFLARWGEQLEDGRKQPRGRRG